MNYDLFWLLEQKKENMWYLRTIWWMQRETTSQQPGCFSSQQVPVTPSKPLLIVSSGNHLELKVPQGRHPQDDATSDVLKKTLRRILMQPSETKSRTRRIRRRIRKNMALVSKRSKRIKPQVCLLSVAGPHISRTSCPHTFYQPHSLCCKMGIVSFL